MLDRQPAMVGVVVALVAATSMLLSVAAPVALALENGLARTPPMGWLAWERFRCDVNCTSDPNNCISETLFKQMADHMVSGGYLAAGYDTIIMDDCWMSTSRLANGTLLADPVRFPNGVKGLADYVHSKGLKMGIYQDYGTNTCGGYPGIYGYIDIDTRDYASWGIDYVKMDGCNVDPATMNKGYPQIGMALNSTGRPMVYSCSWPDYMRIAKIPIDWQLIIQYCNLWRLFDDIQDSLSSVSSIVEYWGSQQVLLSGIAGPGHWNDMDMLIIGDFGLNQAQSEMQMALWAINASPLIMSNDLRNISSWASSLLLNKAIIAVSQDPLGQQGIRLARNATSETWVRILADGSFAIALYNTATVAATLTFQFADLGFSSATVTNLITQQPLGVVTTSYSAPVQPFGVWFIRAYPKL
ncbi:alpha-N-acetylgalactosaminidase [Capsaspora owczarzaki ATCC 30864]|uniref:Alpha-galactosidase n=1 Tax=Capsaspora owczarzaki (strain ATCC 30864) TaxID=595528 RepID=A0A0D2VSN7_CAPO3|nr:alpha-N-acetylgalactosaminidase [Capsaspora owczarzaki ATCC 30864]KJE94117.1 alpha-N-acetylgalactosaminidase [Capsaspora owczarzaki ATCC 30864]|eukprot:XP_004347556.2 alpha-N-acetylgalactosaminidase [Capsaspora owczarzaki ATCC 30864]